MVSKLDYLIHKKVNVTFLQGLDVAAGEGDPDAVDRHLGLRRGLAGFFESLNQGGRNDTISGRKMYQTVPKQSPYESPTACYTHNNLRSPLKLHMGRHPI